MKLGEYKDEEKSGTNIFQEQQINSQIYYQIINPEDAKYRTSHRQMIDIPEE
jgi:hypothetical protein